MTRKLILVLFTKRKSNKSVRNGEAPESCLDKLPDIKLFRNLRSKLAQTRICVNPELASNIFIGYFDRYGALVRAGRVWVGAAHCFLR